MPKTIKSDRNPLTSEELIVYRNKLKYIQEVRAAIKVAFPKFKYANVFTEARAKGGCRSKFWITEGKLEPIVEFVNNTYGVVEASIMNPGCRWQHLVLKLK